MSMYKTESRSPNQEITLGKEVVMSAMDPQRGIACPLILFHLDLADIADRHKRGGGYEAQGLEVVRDDDA